jgi:hypothetical protein
LVCFASIAVVIALGSCFGIIFKPSVTTADRVIIAAIGGFAGFLAFFAIREMLDRKSLRGKD